MSFDLHVHSEESGGHASLNIQGIIIEAKEKRLEGIALTNHDTVEGIEYAAELASKEGIEVIPGIEMSFECRGERFKFFDGEILGYFVDASLPDFNAIFSRSRDSRRARNIELVKKIEKAYGQRFSIKEFLEWVHRKSLDRVDQNEILNFTVYKGFYRDKEDAREKMRQTGLNIQREKTSIEAVVKTILKSGGIPILAHPGLIMANYGFDEAYFENVIRYVNSLGVRGLEVYPYDLVKKRVNSSQTKLNAFFSAMNAKYSLINNVKGSDAHHPGALGMHTTAIETVELLRTESQREKTNLYK